MHQELPETDSRRYRELEDRFWVAISVATVLALALVVLHSGVDAALGKSWWERIPALALGVFVARVVVLGAVIVLAVPLGAYRDHRRQRRSL